MFCYYLFKNINCSAFYRKTLYIHSKHVFFVNIYWVYRISIPLYPVIEIFFPVLINWINYSSSVVPTADFCKLFGFKKLKNQLPEVKWRSGIVSLSDLYTRVFKIARNLHCECKKSSYRVSQCCTIYALFFHRIW